MKMRKLFAALLAVLMLCSIVPFTAVAESASATITFDNVSKRTELDADHQVWQENGITVINNKDASSSNVVDYAKPARFYKNSTLIVEYPGMTKIEFVCNTAAYATALQSSIGANAAAADKVVTVTLSGADSFSCVLSGGQVRLDSLTVYGEGGAPVEPDEPAEPAEPDVPDDSLGVVTNPVEGVAYKLGLNQTQKGAVYYFTGTMSGYYGATDTSVDNAVDIYVEIVDGGYQLYFYDASGAIRYIKLEQSGTHYNFTFGAAGSVFTLDTDLNAFCTPCGDQICYMGTYGSYVTVGCLTTEKMSDGDYIARLYEVGGSAPVEPDEPEVPDEPDTPVDPEPDEPNYDDDIDTTIPYLLGMIQENVSTEDVYFLNGEMDGYYMATTTDEESAIWVYLEKTNGGYYLYALDEDDAKVYINMVVSGTHVNGVYEYTASTVYNYDWDLYTLVAEVNDDVYAFGTRNDKTYVTMGPVKVSYDGFHADLYYFEDDTDTPVDPEPDTPDTPVDPEPDEPDEPNYDEDIDTTIPYLLGMIQENVSTEDVYFLNGEMDGYYMATTTDEESAIWVYLEKTNGGYYLYALDEDDAKVYINMVVSGTHVNGVYEYTASTVYNYDWDLYTLVAEVNGDIYAFGTRNDKTYTTMGPVKVSYEGFHADLYYFTEDEEPCEHEYDHACDDECNLCGDLREVGDHEYSDATDAECNNCGFVRDLPIYGGAIYVDNQSAHAGDTVEVKVQVDNNPGIISAKVRVYFDTTLLEFVSFAEGNFSDSGYSWSDPDVAQEKGYVVINWCEATKPNSMANLLAILTFKVKEDAAEGSYAALTVEFNCDADMFNAADKTVYFDAVSGGVEIVAAPVEPDSVPGDANGDGDINNRDLALLQQHINGWDVTVNADAMDVNNDGDVNNRDLALLQQYINGWDVTLG